ncbi:transposase family protein [Streptomyces sp. NPDC005303]|uniref:transposase family protein n=1 Tax=Streptomyces sp. NPDC005303 TaxID=3155713 RepID=UPI0033AC7DB8
MRVETLKDLLLPGPNLMVRQLTTVDGNLVVDAAGCEPPGNCPQCTHPATRVRSRYWRQISELPVGGRGLIVRLHVRRFFCDQIQCPLRTSVEQVAALTESRRRSSPAARSALRAVAMELGGRPGQRLCAKLRLPGRRTALLSQLVAPPVPARSSAKCTAEPPSPCSEPGYSSSRSHHGSAITTAYLARAVNYGAQTPPSPVRPSTARNRSRPAVTLASQRPAASPVAERD